MNIPALSWLLTYLFNALWQIPLVFAAAWIVVRIAHRSGPRAEHRIWVGALVLQIALPACNLRIAAVWHTLSTLLPAHGNSGSSGVQVLFGPAVAQGGGTPASVCARSMHPHRLGLRHALLCRSSRMGTHRDPASRSHRQAHRVFR